MNTMTKEGKERGKEEEEKLPHKVEDAHTIYFSNFAVCYIKQQKKKKKVNVNQEDNE